MHVTTEAWRQCSVTAPRPRPPGCNGVVAGGTSRNTAKGTSVAFTDFSMLN